MITRKWSDSLRRIYAVCERVPPRTADGLRIRDGGRHKIYSTVYRGYLSSSKLYAVFFQIYFTKDINQIQHEFNDKMNAPKMHASSADSFIVLFLFIDLLTMTKIMIVIKNTSQLNNYNNFLCHTSKTIRPVQFT